MTSPYYRAVDGVGMKLKSVNKLTELLDKAPAENELWVMYKSDWHGVIAFPFTRSEWRGDHVWVSSPVHAGVARKASDLVFIFETS